MRMVVVLVLVALCIGTTGQVLLKMGAHTPVYGPGDLVGNLFRPITLAALVLYGVATLLWITVLSRAALSYAYPLLGLGYVLVVVVSAGVFHETVSVHRWIGVLLVALGFVVVATS